MRLSDLNTKIDIEPYGTIELLGLVLKDMDWLGDTQTKALPAREFAVCLIQSHLISPILDIKTVRGWSDDLLAFVANGWLKDQRQRSDDTAQISFEEFKQTVYAYNDELAGQNRELFDSFLKTQQQFAANLHGIISPIPPIFSGINGSFAQLTSLTNGILNQPTVVSQLADGLGSKMIGLVAGFESLYKSVFISKQLLNDAITSIAQMPRLNFTLPKVLTQQLFAGLPDFTEWESLIKESQESNQAFHQAGYSFTNHLVSYSSVRRFAAINAQVRSAVITNSMASETRSKEFEERLHQLFQQSSVLRRRWKIVAQAIRAHRRRDYCVSVPPLLAQVEGIIGDALILKKLVHREGNELFLKENGKFKLNKKGERLNANGLNSLINHSKWRNHATLQGVAELITSQLAKERNGIMHGRRVDYGTAKLSVQGLLLLLVLATMFVELENGRA